MNAIEEELVSLRNYLDHTVAPHMENLEVVAAAARTVVEELGAVPLPPMCLRTLRAALARASRL